MTAYLRIEGQSSSVSGTHKIGPIELSSATPSGQVTQVVLQSGANTITVPSTPATSGCVITLPSTNTALTTLKGVSGDTGVAIGKTGSIVLSWDSANPPSTFVLTSASTQTGLVTEITFF